MEASLLLHCVICKSIVTAKLSAKLPSLLSLYTRSHPYVHLIMHGIDFSGYADAQRLTPWMSMAMMGMSQEMFAAV